MCRLLVVLSLSSFLLSCATARFERAELSNDVTSLFKVGDIEPDKIGAKDLVFIKDVEHRVYAPTTKYRSGYRNQHHLIVKVLTPEGVNRVANQVVKLPPLGRLLRLEARTVSSDGTIHEISDEDIHYDDQKGSTRVEDIQAFRFPRVEVGSIVEFILESEGPESASFATARIHKEHIHPVEAKRHFYFHSDFGYRVRVKKGAQEVRHQEDDGAHIFSHGMNYQSKTPAQAAPWGPSAEHMETLSLINGFGQTPLWKHVVAGEASVFYFDHRVQMVDAPAFDIQPSCDTVTCVAEAAMNEVRAKTIVDNLGGSAMAMRKLKDVINSGEATGAERAWWVYKLMQNQGVDAQFAFVTRRNTNAIDKSYPEAGKFNQVILRVGNGEESLWLDPTCDWCQVGQLPDRVRGIEVLLTEGTERLFFGPRIETEWVTTTGEAPTPSRSAASYNLKLRENGDVDVEYLEVLNGQAAEDRFLTVQNTARAQLKKEARTWAESVFPTATVISADLPSCDPHAATCTTRRVVRFSNMLLQDKGQVLVPTNILDGSAWPHLGANKSERSELTEEEKKKFGDKPPPHIKIEGNEKVVTTKRSLPIIFDKTQNKEVTIRISSWPKSWQVAAQAMEKKAESKHTRASVKVGMKGNELVLERKLGVDVGWFKPEMNDELAGPFELYKKARVQLVPFKGRLNNKASPKVAPMPATPPPAPATDKDKVEEPPAG